MNITEVCIRKPVLAWMLMAATIVFGGVALSRIGISQFPDVDFPTITVSVTWEGAAPEVMEHDVVEPLEEAVMQVEGVKSAHLSSRQGSAIVTVELDLARNVDLGAPGRRRRRSRRRSAACRATSTRPSSRRRTPRTTRSSGSASPARSRAQVLADYARYRVKERLQTVPGVGEVTMGGYLDRNVRIWVDADKLTQNGMTVTDVIAALRREHVELPGRAPRDRGARDQRAGHGRGARPRTRSGKIVVRDLDGAPVYLAGRRPRRGRLRGRCAASPASTARPRRGSASASSAASNAVAVAQGVKADDGRDPEDPPAGDGARDQLRLDHLHRGVGPRDPVRAPPRRSS